MPSIEKTEGSANVESTHVEKAPNFAELQKQKERLFKEIEQGSLELSQDDKDKIIAVVAGYSIKDSFELSKRLGLDGKDFSFWGFNHSVPKNRHFADTFVQFAEKNRQYINPADYDFYINSIKILLEDKTLAGKGYSPGDWKVLQKYPYAEELGHYYSNFVRNRRVASPEAPLDPRTQIERAGEEHLISTEAVLKESYYTGPIRRYLGLDDDMYLQSELDMESENINRRTGARNATSEEVWALRGNLIDRKTLDSLFESGLAERYDKNDPKFQKVLRHARYAPTQVVFETRKDAVEKGLTKQITQSLIERGYKEDEFEIIFNKEKSEYEVISKEELITSAVPESGKEKDNFRLTNEVLTPQGEKLMGIEIIDGKTYKIYWTGLGRTFYTEYPDGTKTKQRRSDNKNMEVYKSNGHIIITTEGVIEADGKVLNCEGYNTVTTDKVTTNKSKDCVVLDDHFYWVGNQYSDQWKKFVIIKDGTVIATYENAERYGKAPRLDAIGDKLVIFTEIEPQKKRIIFDGEEFGPYDEIKLCENSKDELVFYAEKGNERFVYMGGGGFSNITSNDFRPHKLENIFMTDRGPVLFYSVRDKSYYRYDVATGHEEYVDNYLTNICEIDGKPFYITDSSNNGETSIHWENLIGVEMKFESKNRTVVGFNGRAFISDGKRIISLRSGPEAGDPDLKEMTFDGEVEVVNSGGKLFIIETLQDKKRIYEYSEKLELNEVEQKDLDLANAVAKEDLPAIEEYFQMYYPEGWKNPQTKTTIESQLKEAVEQSKGWVSAINQTIKEAPELFMDILRAKDDKPTQYLMTQMFNYMFPEAQAKRERDLEKQRRNRINPWNIFGGGGNAGEQGGQGGQYSETVDYDPGTDRLASVDEAGYYDMLKANREVLKLREPLPESTFITQGLFGNYTGSGWTKVNVPISQEVHDPAKETTFEFIDEKASQHINLPKIANAHIISERLKGITTRDEEVPIKILEENNLGEVRVDKGTEAKHIAYSQTYSEMPTTMAEVTTADYDKFRKDFEKSFGDVMTRPLGDVGDELDMFVRGIRGKSPREQVIAIQEFCYEYGYYNLDNTPRDTDKFEERLSIMEGRMDDLKAKDPTLAYKMYAGICTDFATLTAGLLRRAGFVSGIASGFVPEAGSTVVKTDRAHAVSYVLWPNPGNKGGKPDMIIVDGTPSSITPRILEQEKKAAEMGGELSVDAEKEFAELEHVLATMDVEAIKKLENDTLEKTLNHILSGVKQSHVDVMNRVLNASRYGSFDVVEMAHGSIDDQIEFRKFLEEEILKEKSATHDVRERRGEELFNLIQDFTRRFEKDKRVENKEGALDVLEKIFDSSDKYLDPIETRSAAAILTYLRARKMR